MKLLSKTVDRTSWKCNRKFWDVLCDAVLTSSHYNKIIQIRLVLAFMSLMFRYWWKDSWRPESLSPYCLYLSIIYNVLCPAVKNPKIISKQQIKLQLTKAFLRISMWNFCMSEMHFFKCKLVPSWTILECNIVNINSQNLIQIQNSPLNKSRFISPCILDFWIK